MSNSQYCIDTNVFITAWEHTYPIKTFPTLWEKLVDKKEQLIIIKPVFDEIVRPDDEKESLSTWLNENGFHPTDFREEQQAIYLEKEYQISEISKGIGAVDIKLICFAKSYSFNVVTMEGIQKQKPQKKENYKIPLVCQEQGVRCIDFIGMLRELKISI